MNRNESQSLREQRVKAHAAAIQLMASGNLSVEKRAQFDRIMADVDSLAKRIALVESDGGNYVAPTSYDPKENSRTLAFGNFIRRGQDSLTKEERTLLETRVDGLLEGSQSAHIGSYTGLGFFVPTGFRDEIEQATKYFANLLDVCQVMTTATGQVIPMPTSNDTTQKAVVVGESTETNEADPTASQILIGAFKYSSGLVKCSTELLQDSSFDLEAWLSQRFGERFGRALEADLTNGSGVGQPTGIITAVLASCADPVIAAGKTESTGVVGDTGANSIGYSDLVRLEHSVDPSYRRNAKYMFHDQTLSQLKRIIDKFGRPLWTPGIGVGVGDSINGRAYVINQSMSTIAAAANTVAFGDFQKYIVRKTKDLSVVRLQERFITAGQVAYLSFARYDGALLDAGTHPVNLLQQHS